MKKGSLVLAALAILLAAVAGGAYSVYRSNSPVAEAVAAPAMPPDTVKPGDKTMGNPKAPVTLIEYYAQACSVCARFNQEVFPRLKAKYIDTGKVRYVMRLYPLFPIDPKAYKLALCVPPSRFFAATDLLFSRQPQWDEAEYRGVDGHAGLLRVAHDLGLADAQAEACMNSTARDNAINQVAQDADARYHPEGTPTIVIDFRKAPMEEASWDAVRVALDAALAAKGAR